MAVSTSSSPLKTVTKPRRVRYVDQETSPDQLEVPVVIWTTEGKTFREEAIVDSGCTETFIDREFVKKHKIPTIPLKKPVPIRNVDGSLVGGKMMTENAVIRLSMGDHHENVTLGVINLDDKPIFLGIDWLKCHNPIINWTKGFVQFDRCPRTCGYKRKDHAQLARKMDVKLEQGDELSSMDVDTYWKE